MLGKLIKYDIRSTWRDFASVYMAIILGVLIIPFLFNRSDNPIINTVAGFLTFGLVVAVVVVTIINLFKIYNTNVFSKEGYLTMTLPVTAAKLVSSKLIVSTMWIILTGIVTALALSILFMVNTSDPFAQLAEAFQYLMAQWHGYSIIPITLIMIGAFLSVVKEIAKLFLACSIAHLKQLNRFRVPAGILSYFIFSWIETLIVQVAVLAVGLLSEKGHQMIITLDNMPNPTSLPEFLGMFNGVSSVSIVYALLLIAAYSFGTIWILNHKLDLD